METYPSNKSSLGWSIDNSLLMKARNLPESGNLYYRQCLQAKNYYFNYT